MNSAVWTGLVGGEDEEEEAEEATLYSAEMESGEFMVKEAAVCDGQGSVSAHSGQLAQASGGKREETYRQRDPRPGANLLLRRLARDRGVDVADLGRRGRGARPRKRRVDERLEARRQLGHGNVALADAATAAGTTAAVRGFVPLQVSMVQAAGLVHWHWGE